MTNPMNASAAPSAPQAPVQHGRGSVLEVGPILRSMKRNKVRFGLIVVEIALTLAIVVNCVRMITTARGEMMHPSGFDDENIVSVQSTPFDRAFQEVGYRDISLRKDLETLRSLPGVRAVAVTGFLPWQGGGSSTMLAVAGKKAAMMRTQIYGVDEGYIDTLGVRLLEGRSFTPEEVERDTLRMRALFSTQREVGPDGTPREKIQQDIVLTKAYAELLFGDTPVLGKLLEDSDGDRYQIIGVVDPFYNPYGWPIHTYAVFFSTKSSSFGGGASFLLRTEPGSVAAVMPGIEKALLAVNGGRNVAVKPLVEIRRRYFSSQQAVVTLMSIVVVLLVLVTSLGIVGLTSFSVAERTRHIGTRRALGARKGDILRHFLLENWLVTTMGLALGLLLAYGLNVALVTSASAPKMGWLLPAAGVVVLWAAGILATLVPALRASRISPAIATRNV